jgi:putative ABC transport system permease protein
MSICNTEYDRYWIEKAGSRQEIQLAVNTFSSDGLEIFGFEAVEGSLDDIIDDGSLAVSETIAKRFGLQIGMTLGYEHNSIRTIKAIFKGMPENSHLRDIQVLRNLGNDGIDDFSEWGYNYFVKLYDPSQIDEMAENLSKTTADFLKEKYFSALPSAKEMGMSQEDYDEALGSFLKAAEVEFVSLEELYFSDNLSNPIEHGSKTTTVILIIVAILIVSIAFINYINFFALVHIVISVIFWKNAVISVNKLNTNNSVKNMLLG